MNLCSLVLLLTGLWLGAQWNPWPLWIELGGVLFLLAQINLHLNLGLALRKQTAQPGHEVLRKRLAVFSAFHHTLVTLATALMIFRWT